MREHGPSRVVIQKYHHSGINNNCKILSVSLLSHFSTTTMETVALIIFIATYTGIIFTRLPWVSVDRPSAAFFGAVAMVAFGVLTPREAVAAVDFNTIALLLGMMILVAVLEMDGFFTFVAEKTISISKTPLQLLSVVVLVTGISSAFLVNDAVVLLYTPVIITICRSGKLDPVPYLIAEILAANIGSAMTVTGNPQNILIGINSGIVYGKFLLYLLPVSLAGMAVIVVAVRLFFPAEFRNGRTIRYEGDGYTYQFASMKVSVPIFIGVLALFFFSHIVGLSIPMISLIGASLVLIFGKIRPSRVIKNVDWVLLLFFAGLFIVVHGAEKTGLIEKVIGRFPLTESEAGIGSVHILSLALSQAVSNVPFTILMLPAMKAAGSTVLWISLASAATLAGNATIVGAMANLIVIETADSLGVKIGFRKFFSVGVTVTSVTMFLSFLIISAEYSAGLFP